MVQPAPVSRGVHSRPAHRAVWRRREVLARLADGRIVAARQGHLLATSFHPELTDDDRFHRYFTELAAEAQPA